MIIKRLKSRTKQSHLILLAVLLLLITACSPTTLESTTIPPPATQTEVVIPRPSPRYNISFAYDSESNQIILYGGAIGYQGPIILDTWAYDVAANKWKEMNPNFDPGGIGFLAYDSESDRVIMFSLFSGDYERLGVTNQTWAYDYNTDTWTRMSDHPRKLIGGAITYDAESDRIILFSGYEAVRKVQYPETWAYDYNTDTWTEMEPLDSPVGRDSHLMTYDIKADRVLLFGGDIIEGNRIDDSLWSYDFNSNTWQELKPDEGPHPESRMYTTLVYDVESDRTILFGGVPTGKDFGTWAYDYNTNTWLEMDPNGAPGTVRNHYLAYIESIDRMFLFGGDLCDKFCHLSNEIWLYDYNTNTWENVSPLP